MPKVDRLIYESANITLDIHYTAKSGMFRCTYAGKTYEHKDVVALKQDVLDALKAAYALEWIPIIEITQPGQVAYAEVQLSLSVERKYIGYHDTLGYKQCHWTAQPEQRLAVSQTFNWRKDEQFDLPAYQDSFTGMTTWLPYTEDTWLKLQEIANYIQIAKRALQNHLIDDAGVTRALEISRLLFDHFSTQDESSEIGGNG